MSFPGNSGSSGQPIPQGTQLNGIYAVDSRLASGGMGEIYLGHEIQTGDPVAIKFIRAEMADDEAALSLFRKEASALNRLHHEAIVRYLVFSLDPILHRHYLAMELVEGESLSDLVKRGPFTLAEVTALLRRVSTGLQAAHDREVVHRDVSPDNVIVKNRDMARARIIDFGIARSTRVGDQTVIGGGFAGKYNYVSPEQLGMYGGDISGKSDTYSLALVAAQCLRGSPINMGGSQVEIVEKRQRVPDLSDIDQRIRPLLEWMLQPDPANRPERIEDVARWLSHDQAAEKTEIILRGPQRVPAAPAPIAVAAGPQSQAARPASPIPVKATEPGRKSHAPIYAIIGVALMGAAGFVGWLQLSDNPQAPRPVPEGKLEVKQQTPGVPNGAPSASLPSPNPANTTSSNSGAQAGLELARFIRSFEGGECFFSFPGAVSRQTANIDGYGTSSGPFQKLEEAVRGKFAVEPNIDVRLVTSSQCPALTFAHAYSSDSLGTPSIALDNDVVKNNSDVWGTIDSKDDFIELLLIDEEGRVQNASQSLDASGLKRRFGLRMQRRNARSFPIGILFMVVTSTRPIGALRPARPTPAREFFEKLKADGDKLSVDVRYLKVID